MENPIAVVKSNLTPTRILGWLIVGVFVLAVADFIGLTPYILTPVTALKAKFGRAAA